MPNKLLQLSIDERFNEFFFTIYQLASFDTNKILALVPGDLGDNAVDVVTFRLVGALSDLAVLAVRFRPLDRCL